MRATQSVGMALHTAPMHEARLGRSAAMTGVHGMITRLANADAPVLIRGQTGVGKELVARALHDRGARRGEPFVAVNCSTLPATLFESIFFGHARGAFTGADRRAPGELELAGRGTLFLDEIAEVPLEVQPKLLRVLEQGRYRPLGGDEDRDLEARVLAATHVDLEARIDEGRFREDLYYRLNVVSLEVPPLAARREEIPHLAALFAGDRLAFTDEALAWLARRNWPGNVRELRNAIERIALLSDEDLVTVNVLEALVPPRRRRSEVDALVTAVLESSVAGSKLEHLEQALIARALELSDGVRARAARLLGVDRKVLDRRVRG